MSKKIVPAALLALKQALTDVYWYKSDLRSFLTLTLSKSELVAQLNWDDYKRSIVAALVDRLSRNEDLFQADLLRLMTEVARVEDFEHLLRLDDGKAKAKKAAQAVLALRKYVGNPTAVDEEEEEIEARRQAAFAALLKTTAVQDQLERIDRTILHPSIKLERAESRISARIPPAGPVHAVRPRPEGFVQGYR